LSRILACILLVVLGSHAAADSAAKFPEGNIRLVVPLAAGGNIDVMARILAERLSEQFGQRVLVENVVGAGGSIGARTVAQAKPDGYTLLFQGPAQASLPYMYKKLPYDGIGDFTGVSLVGEYPLVIVINSKIPVQTLPEWVAMLKASPGKYTYGSSGVGGASHLAAELFRSLAGVEITHVPFRGNNPAMVALLAGQIDMLIDGIAAQRAHIDEGKVRLLAVATRERSPWIPTTPAISETAPGYHYPLWLSVFAPAKTPSPIVEKLSAQIAIATKDPTLQKRFKELMVEPKSSTPRETDAFFKEQLKFNEEFIARAKIPTVD
jgi:tripartite-type tricarboxylate transporter receptor subunit TctC